ncbi:transposase [Bradyrhizobium sp. 192]|uniref:transposase n=1 Tax=Bradyrhizobium sp. 192 TaxID=2782660 RepID=UPI001FFE7A7E|nr:transposase [Bradyrhizobium sp. 192]
MVRYRELVLGHRMSREIEALIIDDTGFRTKGRHPVRVARQYFGQIDEQDNCQVALSGFPCKSSAFLPVAYHLDLMGERVQDRAHRRQSQTRPTKVARLRGS